MPPVLRARGCFRSAPPSGSGSPPLCPPQPAAPPGPGGTGSAWAELCSPGRGGALDTLARAHRHDLALALPLQVHPEQEKPEPTPLVELEELSGNELTVFITPPEEPPAPEGGEPAPQYW